MELFLRIFCSLFLSSFLSFFLPSATMATGLERYFACGVALHLFSRGSRCVYVCAVNKCVYVSDGSMIIARINEARMNG